MPYQIFITRSLGSVLPVAPDFLRSFIQAVRDGLSTDATVESPLRKPIQTDPKPVWIFCFGKQGVLYQVESGTEIKLFLSLKIDKEEGYSEAELVQFIKDIQTEDEAKRVIQQYSAEPRSSSLDEIEKAWLPDEAEERRWAKAKLDLLIECGPQLDAQRCCDFFQGKAIDLADQAKYQCRTDVLQDAEQNWWCRVRPVLVSITPKMPFHNKVLQLFLYEELRSAPAFRYAFACVGAYEAVFTGDPSQAMTYSQVLDGHYLAIATKHGFVVSDVLWNAIPDAKKLGKQIVQAFKSDYIQIPVARGLVRATDHQPVLDPNPHSAEEYYNNGCILGHRGQHREALTAFEMALVLKPTFQEARVGRETARRHLV